MHFNTCLVCFYLSIPCFVLGANNLYGFYRLEPTVVKSCPGQSTDTIEFTYENSVERGNNIGLFNLTVKKDVPKILAKITGSRILKDGKVKDLVRLHMPSFCETILKEVLMNQLPIYDDCSFKKGFYPSIVIDPTKICKMLFGTQFFYGHYVTKIEIFSTKKKIVCFTTEANLTSIK